MAHAATLREVAEKAGVAVPTASRVLNQDPSVRVRDETRKRITDTAHALGYSPSSIARSLRGSRTGSIGLIMHDLASPINVALLKGAQSRCTEAGSVTLLADFADLATNDSQLRTILERGRLDGVILQTGYGPGDRLVEDIASTLPAVLVNSEGSSAAPSISLEDDVAGSLATEHLAGLGHRRIAFIGGPKGAASSERRERGYRKTMDEHGLKSMLVPGGWTAVSGVAAVKALLQRKRRPTAVVVANAVTAAGVLSAFRDAQVSVPEQISVVAIHDPWFVDHLWVALTTVRLPLFELGFGAAGMLFDRLDGKTKVLDRFIDDPRPELVRRQSTGAPSSG
jgi:DNA-binding LacI/PurR family transcriptional regulator